MGPRPTPARGLRARGRRGESLASLRDRARLRERDAAERARVEGMLASVPVPVERRAQTRNVASTHLDSRLRSLKSPSCPVCGDGRIVTDEVMHGGRLQMSECLHCEHRWTRRPKQRWIELGMRMNRSGQLRALQAQSSESGVPPSSRSLRSSSRAIFAPERGELNGMT